MNSKLLIEKIKEIHGSDKEQLDFVFSNEKRIIVTAPAGCGKTKSMISKIAYEIVNNQTMNYKKILALTFSVNAAAKIKEDTNEILPIILGNKDIDVSKKLDVSNYHNFSMKLIKKHGFSLSENLEEIDSFLIVPENSKVIMGKITASEQTKLMDYDKCLKEVNIAVLKELEKDYLDILLEKLIPNNILTFNGLLLIALKLLEGTPIQEFYRKYYPIIIVDEFQDTNFLSYRLITNLFGENRIILMGDDIQKIYGFLGAIPDLFNHMANEYNMKQMEFRTNYRFKDNEEMKKLDNYLRGIFKNYNKMDSFQESAIANFKFFKSISGEAKFIVNDILQKIGNGNKIAVLVRAGFAANHVIEELESKGITYFNGLFSDQNIEYVKFHEYALSVFIEESENNKSVSKKVLSKVLFRLQGYRNKIITDSNNMFIFDSLYKLLEALFNNLKELGLGKFDKYNKVIFTLSNGSLKHVLNEINADITLTTIHGSKGLEWDFVYIPEMTSYTFPSSKSICKECGIQFGRTLTQNTCTFNFVPQLRDRFEEELSLFYVAVTRAKQDVFLFANIAKNNFGYSKKACCFITLPNLKLKTLQSSVK